MFGVNLHVMPMKVREMSYRELEGGFPLGCFKEMGTSATS
jgi:hypothetical protein